jgi:DNA helicase-2/ATP-dependent DNA helicase PcrA
MSDLLANLNERQLAAVTLPAQHALILAGAGSGKDPRAHDRAWPG